MIDSAFLDWRRRFAEYEAALGSHVRAQALVDQLQARRTACATDQERSAVDEGLAVAIRRLRLTNRTLVEATNAFIGGLSVLEAIWDAPDDI